MSQCHVLPARLALTPSKLQAASTNGTAFVTFADGHLSRFALNWAQLLQELSLRSIVGISGHLERSVERAFHAAGAGVFCADGPLMAANGQAGRWAELLPVLRMARTLNLVCFVRVKLLQVRAVNLPADVAAARHDVDGAAVINDKTSRPNSLYQDLIVRAPRPSAISAQNTKT